ncbi:hypothetical protein G7046_g5548 [Stylonectria norvegica]|nr:hypothetical protein G7046_g5548 [Stylonectria norvegica]
MQRAHAKSRGVKGDSAISTPQMPFRDYSGHHRLTDETLILSPQSTASKVLRFDGPAAMMTDEGSQAEGPSRGIIFAEQRLEGHHRLASWQRNLIHIEALRNTTRATLQNA